MGRSSCSHLGWAPVVHPVSSSNMLTASIDGDRSLSMNQPRHSGKHQPPPSWGPLRLQPLSGLREPPLSWLLASRWTVTYSQAMCFQRPLSTCSQHTEESLSLSLPGIPPHHSHTQALAYCVYPERTSYILDTGPDLEHTALTSRHRILECGG